MSWPRVGGGVRIDAGVRRELERQPDLADRRPQAGCSCSTVIPSATASGEANAATMSLIGPHGISAASSAVEPGRPVARSRNRAARIGRSSARCSTRSPFVAKRGSSASSGSPSAAQSRGHWRSEPTATAIAPSAVSNVSYGTMFGWALPSRPGATPADERVLGLVDEAGQRRPEERDVDPLAAARPAGPAPAPLVPARRAPPSTPTAPSIPVSDVADRDPDLGRAAAVGVGGAGDRHQPARRLDRRSRSRVGRRPGRSVP